MSFDNDLNRLRPRNFYLPEEFYPAGCHDDVRDRNEEMFLMRFRFRVSHFRRFMTAMRLDGNVLTIGGYCYAGIAHQKIQDAAQSCIVGSVQSMCIITTSKIDNCPLASGFIARAWRASRRIRGPLDSSTSART